MTTDSALDRLLADHLTPAPDDDEDRQFISTTMQLIAQNERFRRQRQRLWRDALAQIAAVTALVLGLIRFSQLPAFTAFGLAGDSLVGIAPPLVLVLALWLASSGILGQLRGTTPISRTGPF